MRECVPVKKHGRLLKKTTESERKSHYIYFSHALIRLISNLNCMTHTRIKYRTKTKPHIKVGENVLLIESKTCKQRIDTIFS